MLEPRKREFMTAKKIHDDYKEGRRDFSGVVCNSDLFDGFDLREIIFAGANLDFCGFYGTKLNGADFSGASLEWTNFTQADLRHASFAKARAVWSKFNEAQLEKTNMRGADLSWCLFFNTNLYGGCDLNGAMTGTLATDPSQITEEGMQKLAEHLGKMQGKIDPELMTRIRLAAISTDELTKKVKKDGTARDAYARGNTQENNTVEDYKNRDTKSGDPYGPIGAYKKKKKDIYEN